MRFVLPDDYPDKERTEGLLNAFAPFIEAFGDATDWPDLREILCSDHKMTPEQREKFTQELDTLIELENLCGVNRLKAKRKAIDNG